MKITDIRVKVFAVPGGKEKPDRRNWIFVRIDTDEGIHGYGEATTEQFDQAVVAAITQDIGPNLIGEDPTRIEYQWQKMQRLYWWRNGIVQSSAISGIDQALWDVTGKAFGQPVYRLLGGAVRDRVQLYPRHDLGLPLDEEIAVAKAEGYTAFKAGIATRTAPFNVQQAEHFIEKTHAYREMAGPDMELMVDVGGTMPLPMAAKYLAGVERDNLLFVEEVVNGDTPRDLKTLRQAFPSIAIAFGERLATRWGFREYLDEGAADVIQPDLSHCGGISEVLKIANMAEVHSVRVAPHGPYGPVNKAAGIHAAAVMPNFMILEHCRMEPWYSDVQTEGLTIRHGFAELPTAPGLGVELDWKGLDAHPYRAACPLGRFTREDGSESLV